MSVSKEKMVELVKNAPEGAVKWSDSDDSHYAAYYDVNGRYITVNSEGEHRNSDWQYDHIYLEVSNEVKLDYSVLDEKPVYTQVMSDAGELPPVGSECIFMRDGKVNLSGSTDSWENGDLLSCICHSTSVGGEPICVVRHDDGLSISILSICLKPINQRTKEEKLIDDLRKWVSKTDAQEIIRELNLVTLTCKDANND